MRKNTSPRRGARLAKAAVMGAVLVGTTLGVAGTASAYLQTFATLWAIYQDDAIKNNTAQLQHVLSNWGTVLQLARTHQTP